MRAFHAGSFDPPTLGHLDLIGRAARLYDALVVGIGINPERRGWMPVAERLALLQAEIADRGLTQVEVITYEGATVLAALARGAGVLIRGVRGSQDLSYETAMAVVNREHGLETVFLPATAGMEQVSGSLARQVVGAGLRLDRLLPARVIAHLQEQGRHVPAC